MRYELAGLGSRLLAVTIDLLVQIAMISLITWGFYWLGTHAPKIDPGDHKYSNESLVTNIMIGFIIFIVFAVFFGYFILFEAFWNGQTLGKKALGIRVVRDGGYPVDFTASLVRNLIRIGEMLVGFYAVAGIVSLISPMNKRLGDIAAGTIVVRDAKMDSPVSMLKEMREEPTYASTAYVSGEERAIIKRFLERRWSLSAQRRMVLASELANRVRPRVPDDMKKLDDEALLERL